MIFSHVLYQLSYLAQTKNPPEPGRRGRESAAKDRLYRLPAPARVGGLHVSVTVQSIGVATLSLLTHPYVGSAALRRRF
jgi:uncharacterized protein with FMN-binding domain